MPERDEVRRESTGTPAAPGWAELFLALDQQDQAQLLARLDVAEGHDERQALLVRLVALRLTARPA